MDKSKDLASSDSSGWKELIVCQMGAVAGSELQEGGASLARESGFARTDARRARAEDPIRCVRGNSFLNFFGVELPNEVRIHSRRHNAVRQIRLQRGADLRSQRWSRRQKDCLVRRMARLKGTGKKLGGEQTEVGFDR